jgi:AcrR family transcriptional regulator
MGLRERKKQQTRDAIVDAALRLFAERGYERTTVADIAAAVDIAPRTFFGYFAAKEDVVFHDFDDLFERFAAGLAERPEGGTVVDALRAVIAGFIEEVDFDDPLERVRRRLIVETPALAERDRALFGRFEHVLAEAVARDFAVPADSVRPRMVAAAATAAMSALEAFYEDPGDPCRDLLAEDDPMSVIDELLVFLRGGIAALADHPLPPPSRPRAAAGAG